MQLAQAKGQLAKDQATLANARLDLARYQKLAKTHLVSQQELDNQAALVKQSEASISIDKAAINNAQLQLTYSKITAPISGRVGLKQVDVGNYISGGSSTPIVVINQMDPVDVLFTLPEQDLSQVILARKNSPTLPVIALDRNNKIELAQGALFSVDNQIDATTGTIKLKARFPQQESTLFPNQFVNIRLYVTTLEKAVVIPMQHYKWEMKDTLFGLLMRKTKSANSLLRLHHKMQIKLSLPQGYPLINVLSPMVWID